MLSLQQRLRALLLANPWFQSPVQVIIEDKDGIEFLVTRATEKLEAPLVVVQTTSATADRRYAGIAYSNEELVVSIVTTPATDGSGKLYIEGVLAAIATVHESLVDGATSTHPDTPKFHYTGHADASAKPGEVIHQITFTAPILIQPGAQNQAPEETYTKAQLDAAVAAARAETTESLRAQIAGILAPIANTSTTLADQLANLAGT